MRKIAGISFLLVAVMGITSLLDPKFLAPFNLMNIARWTGLFGIITIGEAFVIISGGIDLSVGSVAGLMGTLLPLFVVELGIPLWLTIPILFLFTLLIGLLHGLLITKLKMQPFIVTLCGLFVYRGIARYVTSDITQGFGIGFSKLRYLANGTPLSIPFPFIILVIVAIISGIFLHYSVYGRYLFALGRNETAARFSGINTDRMILVAYISSALLAGFAGILFALDLNSIQPSGHGNFYELYAIAGAVLGGCSLRGGEGSIIGVIIGTAIVRVLYNAINILGIATQLEFAVIGIVILVGVMADELVRRYAVSRRLRC